MHIILSIAISLCFLTGSLLSLTSSIGMIRFPNTITRMHAGTKAQTLGILLMILGAALANLNDLSHLSMLLLSSVFILLTASATGHRIGKIAYYEQIEKKPDANDEFIDA